jgi:hypothetical protein
MILVDDLMVLRPLVRRANYMRGNSVRNVGSDERKPFPICMAVEKRRLVGQKPLDFDIEVGLNGLSNPLTVH